MPDIAEAGLESGQNDKAPSYKTEEIADRKKRLRQIKHRTEYQDDDRGVLVADIEEDKSKQVIDEEKDLILEIVDVRMTSEVPKGQSYPPPYDLQKGHSYIVIHSPAVLEALRCIVDYFPAHDLSGNTLKILEPYEILVFFEKELSQYRQRLLDEPPNTSCLNNWAYEHITIVQEFVREQLQEKIDAETERHAQGYVTFDMLWLLYKPGDDVYTDLVDVGGHTPWVVKTVDFSIRNGSSDYYRVNVWNICGNSTWVGPRWRSVQTERFAGERKITELNAFPCKYLRFMEGLDEEQAEEIRRYFIKRGEKWFALRRRIGCHSFDGLIWQGAIRHMTSLVMVDTKQYPRRNGLSSFDERVSLLTNVEKSCSPRKICSCARCKRVIYNHAVKPRFIGYTNINPLLVDHLTEHQYFLCDEAVEAFVYKTRTWTILHVDGFKAPEFHRSLFDSLVLPRATKDMIKNLTATYIRNSRDHAAKQKEDVKYKKIDTVHRPETPELAESTWSVDFIQGKGEGLTFLLHGKPGVGKTYTAECIADHVGRPLLTLTCADLGSDPLSIEENLQKWFQLGDRWDAIMLIDEADIYMEERRVQDIERNHLVAGFLRALEYFRGILFLTTNRVGTFDEAFISRIHIQIYYPDFSDEDREKVWQTYFRKLAHEREKTMRVVQDAKDYVTGREVKALRWNGREIRNAFQVAVGLAQAEGDRDDEGRVLIKSDHIQATVNMSREFKDYLQKLHKHDQGKLAALKGHRYDSFGSQSQSRGKEDYD